MKRKLTAFVSFLLMFGMLSNSVFAQEFRVPNQDGGYDIVELMDIESLNTDIYVMDSNLDKALKEAAGKSEDYVFTASDSTLFSGKTLDLSQKNITSLKGIEKFSGITGLDLSLNKITSLEPLEGMTSLTTLDASGNRICDITPVAELTKLTTLNLADNLIGKSGDEDTLEEISKMTGLKTLVLDNNVISDASVFSGLSNLATLSINNCSVQSLEDIGSLNLTELYAKANNLSSLDGISNISSLQTLDVDNNNLTDLLGIEKLGNLVNFYASENNINDISGVEDLTALRVLSLGYNSITNLESLGKSTANLYALYLNNNNIWSDNLKYLSNFKVLRYLYLNDNNLSIITPIKSLTWLWELDLSNNDIIEVYYTLDETDDDEWSDEEITSGKRSIFHALTSLKNLSIANNTNLETDDLTYLKRNTRLVNFDVDAYPETDASFLLNLSNLKTVNTGCYAKNFATETETALIAKGVEINKDGYEDGNIDNELVQDISKSFDSVYSSGNILKYTTTGETLDKKAKKIALNKDLENVKSVRLTDTYYTSFDALEYFTNLESIDICVNQGASFDVFEKMPNLKSGNIYSNGMIDDTTTAMLEEKGLTVHRNTLDLTNISSENPDLEKAIKEFYNVPDDGIVYLDEVNYLDLTDANLISLSSLENFSNLTTLSISGNQPDTLEPIESLSKLTYLYMDNVNAESLDSIKNLTELKYVSANDNMIVEGLLTEGDFSNLEKLKYLSANSNGLLYTTGIETAPALEYLYLINNNITDISSLEDAPKLKEVDIRLNVLDLSPTSDTMKTVGNLQANSVVVYTDDYIDSSGESDTLLGDADGNGSITSTDALLTLQYTLNPDNTDVKVDNIKVTASGDITATNALEILQKSLNSDYVFSKLK